MLAPPPPAAAPAPRLTPRQRKRAKVARIQAAAARKEAAAAAARKAEAAARAEAAAALFAWPVTYRDIANQDGLIIRPDPAWMMDPDMGLTVEARSHAEHLGAAVVTIWQRAFGVGRLAQAKPAPAPARIPAAGPAPMRIDPLESCQAGYSLAISRPPKGGPWRFTSDKRRNQMHDAARLALTMLAPAPAYPVESPPPPPPPGPAKYQGRGGLAQAKVDNRDWARTKAEALREGQEAAAAIRRRIGQEALARLQASRA